MALNKEEEAYTQRSAVCWAYDINVPVLIMHGDANTVMDVSQAYTLRDALQKYNKKHVLIVYPQGDHSLHEYQEQVHNETARWFESLS